VITAWTPTERELLGINDTDDFIRDTQRVLDRVALEKETPRCPVCGMHVRYLEAHLEGHPQCRADLASQVQT
jgi:multidrug resistance efflux pump